METQLIKGEKVIIRLAGAKDKRRVYAWLAQSDVTAAMMGPPDFPDTPVPTWDEFLQDYRDFYFNDSKPKLGRFFIIMAEGKDVGAVSYCVFKGPSGIAELDIWMSSEANCGKGYGPDALRTLCRYLSQVYQFEEFIIRPSARNKRAIRAYEKAGFALAELTSREQEKRYGPGDYEDAVLMLKKVDLTTAGR